MSPLFADVLGHKTQIDYLTRVLENGRTAHAYCFSGPAHVGKTRIAEQVIATLGGEVTEVSLPIDEKTGAVKTTIPAESIRALRDRLQLSTFSAVKKIAVIHDADRMTLTAQNALLKILEEPVGDTVLILLATHAERLLPTILSRVVHLTFTLVPREDICADLRKRMDAELAHTVAGVAAGRPGVAFALSEREVREEVIAELRETITFLQAPLVVRLRETEIIAKEKDDRERLRTFFSHTRVVLHDCLLAASSCEHLLAVSVLNAQIQELAGAKTANEWASILSSLTDAERAIEKNGNIGLSLDAFALSL